MVLLAEDSVLVELAAARYLEEREAHCFDVG